MSKIWIASKAKAWEIADVISFDDNSDEVVVETKEDGRKTVQKNQTHRADPSHFEDFDDLCAMNHLHEAPLLHTLRRRFQQDLIYTTTGDVLISVNPYKSIVGLYDNKMSFLDLPEDGELQQSSSKPHVYKIANNALVRLLYGNRAGEPTMNT